MKGDSIEAFQKLVSYGFVYSFCFLVRALIAIEVVNTRVFVS
jgi:hypothetical protein